MSVAPWLKLLRNTLPLVLVSTLLSVISSAQTQQPIFPKTSFMDAGAQTLMATGDFNGDGQPDLVTIPATNGPIILSVLLNAANPTTPLIVTTALGPSITGIAHLVAADMNNDKKLDLVANAQSSGSSGIAILLGNGDGTFQSPAFYPLVGPGNLVVTDLNGDGYPDLAIITAQTLLSLKVAVLLNQGSNAPGTLSAPTSYPLSISFAQSGPLNIGAGDFNGDGKQDILVGGTNLAVFYGQGDGTLQSQQSPVVPIGLIGGGYFVASDLNHDGISDVAYIAASAANTSILSLQVLLGHSNGTFTVGSNLPLSLSNAYPAALVPAGTTNGGTNLNLAAVSDKTSILLGDGNGNFSLGLSYAMNGTPFPVLNSSGKTDLVFELSSNLISSVDNQITRLTANGDGTFQGIPTLPLNSVFPFGFVAADLNGDGLTDVLYVDSQNNLVTGLGRGNGTFTVTNRVADAPSKLFVTSDFSGDGNPDVAIITQGDASHYPSSPVVDSMLVLYNGNGDGSFQSPAAPVDLQVVGAMSAVTSDFNGDGTADVVVAYSNGYNDPTASQGLVFLPGKGDGTFGTALPLTPQSFSFATPQILAADLNNDHKLDLLWNGSIYLGNGDGTFNMSTVSLPGPVLAVGDLNGDGIPDVVIGTSVYAGNGDGTFQSSPLYTATLPSNAQITLATISHSHGDASPDLLLQYQLTGTGTNSYQAANTYLAVFLGDGKGNFVADSNNYYVGNLNNVLQGLSGSSPTASMAVPARLNNQAPPLSNDTALDYLTWTNDGATALLNQINPTPTALSPLPSKTTLTDTRSNPAPTQPIIFYATVTGVLPAFSPSGSVTFTAGGMTLGTGPVVNGIASLTFSFPAAGTYSVIASYSGDSNNAPSASAAVSITVARVASSTSIGLPSPTPGANQPTSFLASVGGYNPSGTLTFSIAGTTIGTIALSNSVATFPYAFPAAGTVVVTATYSGDVANLPSSTTDTVTVQVPNFIFSAPGAVATITAGQSATTTLNVISEYGYHGTINLSCSGLAVGENCTFSPTTLTPPADGSLVSSTIITSTTAPSSARLRDTAGSLHGIAWASLLGLMLLPRRIWQQRRRLMQTSILTLVLAVSLMYISGCAGSSPSTSQNAGTPAGTQTITVTAADSAGGPSHTLTLQLTVR